MATLNKFICKKCGFSIWTTKLGHYAIMHGNIFQFHCHNCKEIVSIPYDIIGESRFGLKCPSCNQYSDLSMWNPIECSCPKCGEKLEDTGQIIMAD